MPALSGQAELSRFISAGEISGRYITTWLRHRVAKDKQVDFFQKVVEEKMEEEKSKEQQEAEKEAVARLQTEDNGGGKMVE